MRINFNDGDHSEGYQQVAKNLQQDDQQLKLLSTLPETRKLYYISPKLKENLFVLAQQLLNEAKCNDEQCKEKIFLQLEQLAQRYAPIIDFVVLDVNCYLEIAQCIARLISTINDAGIQKIPLLPKEKETLQAKRKKLIGLHGKIVEAMKFYVKLVSQGNEHAQNGLLYVFMSEIRNILQPIAEKTKIEHVFLQKLDQVPLDEIHNSQEIVKNFKQYIEKKPLKVGKFQQAVKMLSTFIGNNPSLSDYQSFFENVVGHWRNVAKRLDAAEDDIFYSQEEREIIRNAPLRSNESKEQMEKSDKILSDNIDHQQLKKAHKLSSVKSTRELYNTQVKSMSLPGQENIFWLLKQLPKNKEKIEEIELIESRWLEAKFFLQLSSKSVQEIVELLGEFEEYINYLCEEINKNNISEVSNSFFDNILYSNTIKRKQILSVLDGFCKLVSQTKEKLVDAMIARLRFLPVDAFFAKTNDERFYYDDILFRFMRKLLPYGFFQEKYNFIVERIVPHQSLNKTLINKFIQYIEQNGTKSQMKKYQEIKLMVDNEIERRVNNFNQLVEQRAGKYFSKEKNKKIYQEQATEIFSKQGYEDEEEAIHITCQSLIDSQKKSILKKFSKTIFSEKVVKLFELEGQKLQQLSEDKNNFGVAFALSTERIDSIFSYIEKEKLCPNNSHDGLKFLDKICASLENFYQEGKFFNFSLQDLDELLQSAKMFLEEEKSLDLALQKPLEELGEIINNQQRKEEYKNEFVSLVKKDIFLEDIILDNEYWPGLINEKLEIIKQKIKLDEQNFFQETAKEYFSETKNIEIFKLEFESCLKEAGYKYNDEVKKEAYQLSSHEIIRTATEGIKNSEQGKRYGEFFSWSAKIYAERFFASQDKAEQYEQAVLEKSKKLFDKIVFYEQAFLGNSLSIVALKYDINEEILAELKKKIILSYYMKAYVRLDQGANSVSLDDLALIVKEVTDQFSFELMLSAAMKTLSSRFEGEFKDLVRKQMQENKEQASEIIKNNLAFIKLKEKSCQFLETQKQRISSNKYFMIAEKTKQKIDTIDGAISKIVQAKDKQQIENSLKSLGYIKHYYQSRNGLCGGKDKSTAKVELNNFMKAQSFSL